MTTIKFKKHNFFIGFLHSIIFDKNDLEVLKTLISKLTQGVINSVDLRKQILESRNNIMDKILKNLPEFINIIYQKDPAASELNAVKKELEEKKEFLTEVACEVSSIHDKIS